VTADFYSTLAQVLPVLLLAFIWDSGFLTRLRRQRRRSRQQHPAGVWFWTKPRVRVYTLSVAGIVLGCLAVTVLVLGGLIPDSRALRIVLSAAFILVLLTLLTRITVDVMWATTSTTAIPGAAGQPGRDPGAPAVPPPGPAAGQPCPAPPPGPGAPG
jgi:hypothetical protein